MKIIYAEQLNFSDTEKIRKNADECGILFETARLLYCRKTDTPEKIKRFFSPGKRNFGDPFSFRQMNLAVQRIERALNNSERVVVFGDYDADGICATAILIYALKEYGIDPIPLIPERDDGYGLNQTLIENLHGETPVDLIITVDCGISDAEKIDKIKSLGIDVIVTDHHEPPDILPECIVLNPKVKGETYPFDGLCGAGVAFKLACALIKNKADSLLDFAALATVADSMELSGENRDIVFEGLKLFNKNLRPCFQYILGDNKKQITSHTLAFVIAPRINAGGRMGDARCALELFTLQGQGECFDRAVKLSRYNMERQAECDGIYRVAKQKIKDEGICNDRVLTVYDQNWKTGFVGIVAARLAEEFNRPVIVFAGYCGVLKGSARSTDNINIYEVISSAKELLVGFGGHAQAAGVTVDLHNFSALRNALNKYVSERYPEPDAEKKIYAEWKIDKSFPLDFAREIEQMEPFGVGNVRPLFGAETGAVRPTRIKADSAHYSFTCPVAEILDFNGEKDVEILSMPIKKQLVFEPNMSVFRGKEYFKGFLKSVVPDYSCANYGLYIFMRELKKLSSYCEPYYKDCAPSLPEISREELSCGGYGTIFCVNDYSSLKNYPSLKNLPASFFLPERENYSNCVVISLSCVPEGYERIIYLDTPLGFFKNVENFIAADAPDNGWINKISTERSDVADIYNTLKNYTGKEFLSSADFYEKNRPCENGFQFVFVCEVLLELGIFFIKDGTLRLDARVKNALTNSVLYSKISLIKG